jgi:hypothetical protein
VACGHHFCSDACLEQHRQGYHGLPPRDPPLWFNAITTAVVAYVFLFASAVLFVGLFFVSDTYLGPLLRAIRPSQAQPVVQK